MIKHYIFATALGLSLCSSAAFAQNAAEPAAYYPNNNIKLNLPALALGNFSMQYERGLSSRTSISLGLRLMPNQGLPLKGLIHEYVESDEPMVTDFIEDTRMSNWAITPEFRYYFGKKPLHGFYVAPFARIAGFSMSLPYIYTDNDGGRHPIDLSGKISMAGGGLMLGSQWRLGRHVSLDLWILGAGMAHSSISLDGRVDLSELTAEERADAEQDLESTTIGGRSLDAEIRSDGASIRGNFPLPMVRSGLSLGITF